MLKAGQRSKISRVGDKEFDQISRVGDFLTNRLNRILAKTGPNGQSHWTKEQSPRSGSRQKEDSKERDSTLVKQTGFVMAHPICCSHAFP